MRRGAALLALTCSLGCPKAEPPAEPPAEKEAPDPRTVVRRSHRAMGSMIAIAVYTDREGPAVEAMQAVFAEFDRLEALLTTWRIDSDVSRINAKGAAGPVKVRAETLEVVQRAIALAEKTEGKFDVTFGALSGLWRFDHDKDGKIPDPEEVKARLPFVDYRTIQVDERASTVALAKKGVKIHLGGIGKGYAVDEGVTLLRKAGFENFMVQAGGDLYVAGTRGDRPWRVGIRDPRGDRNTFFAAAEVTDATFSTSGDYERFFVKDGVRYHHILDPDVGRPARKVRSVTIMAPEATIADALSTGVFILGVEKGLAVVEATPGVGAVIVDAKNRVHISERLEGKVRILKPPSDGP